MVQPQPEDIPEYSENTPQRGGQNAADHRKGTSEPVKPLF